MLLSSNDILLFLGFAVLAGLALLALLRPLVRGRRGVRADAGESEVALYRDQLTEISRDLERGVIGEPEAAAARVEISRRLLAADETRKTERGVAAADPRWRKAIAIALVLGLPVLALGVYLDEGSPGLSGQPFAARMSAPPDELPLEALVLRIERHLKEKPDDLRGWELVAPAYLKLGHFDRAARAWTRAMSVGGVTAGRLAARGEANVFADGGVVGPDAKADFERAVALDPDQPRAQYFLGVAELDAGHRDAALARWRALIARAPDGAPWVQGLKAGIANLEGGPEIAAEDASMIRGMVAGLAARLEEEPGDLDGWLRLIRSYRVLGDHDKAAAALASARAAFAGNREALESLKAAEDAPAD